MKLGIITVLVLVTLAGVGLWWWFIRCERACLMVDHKAQDLFQGGELLSALTHIDAVDARCHCSRFTSGDAPPQYALARACLRKLRQDGRESEAASIIARARGPILKELSKGRC